MSVAEQAPDTHVTAPASAPELHLMTAVDRRADVESKQIIISDLLKDIGCDGLLVLKEENFAWLTGGGISRGIVDTDSMPVLYFNGDARWLVCSQCRYAAHLRRGNRRAGLSTQGMALASGPGTTFDRALPGPLDGLR